MGYRNHFKHQKPDVAACYDARQIMSLRIDKVGVVAVALRNGRIALVPVRQKFFRYWETHPQARE